MKRLMTKTLILATSLFALFISSLSSAGLNIRQEYVSDTGKSKTRALVDHRFASNIGMSFEVKWEDTIFKNLKASGHEVGVNYDWKILEDGYLTLQPGFLIDTPASKDGVTYKYQLRATTKFVDNHSISLRYRYRMTDYANTPTNHIKNSEYQHQLNLVTSYKFEYIKVGVDLEYKFLEYATGWEGKDYDYLVDFSFESGKSISGWVPFANYALITAKGEDSDVKDVHHNRIRFGVKYAF